MDMDFYKYNRNEILKRKTMPYQFGNREAATETFEEFVKEFPSASYHEFGIRQWICVDHRARKKLAQELQKKIDKRKKEIEELEKELEKIYGKQNEE